MRAADAPPLEGLRIVVTRRPEQARTLVERLTALGAQVKELPTVAIAPPEDPSGLDAALHELHRYDWIVFTSANAVGAVADGLARLGLDAAPVGRSLLVASVGPTTSDAVLKRFPGASVALQPHADFRAEGLVEALLSRGVAAQRFLLPLSDHAGSALSEAISRGGGRADGIVAYRTIAPEDLGPSLRALLEQGVDLVTFASPSAVQNLAAGAGELVGRMKAAVIGPVTEAAAIEA